MLVPLPWAPPMPVPGTAMSTPDAGTTAVGTPDATGNSDTGSNSDSESTTSNSNASNPDTLPSEDCHPIDDVSMDVCKVHSSHPSLMDVCEDVLPSPSEDSDLLQSISHDAQDNQSTDEGETITLGLLGTKSLSQPQGLSTCSNPLPVPPLYFHAGEEEKAAQRAAAAVVVKVAIDRAVVRVSQRSCISLSSAVIIFFTIKTQNCACMGAGGPWGTLTSPIGYANY